MHANTHGVVTVEGMGLKLQRGGSASKMRARRLSYIDHARASWPLSTIDVLLERAGFSGCPRSPETAGQSPDFVVQTPLGHRSPKREFSASSAHSPQSGKTAVRI